MIQEVVSKLKKLFAFCLVIIFCVSASLTVSAKSVTDTYTKADIPGDTTEMRLSREIYSPEKTINASSLGLSEALTDISDICTYDDGSILLITEKKSRLIKINPDFSLNKEITVHDKDGNNIDFNGAKGVYVDKNGEIFISDTSNSRIIVIDENGELKRTLGTPESSLIPEDFYYQPVAVERDPQGYLYVLSKGCYYGTLMYSPNEEFLGFYGSNTVSASVLDSLSTLWNKLTSNDTKKSNSVKKLPYSFSDFDFSSSGYMVTSTGRTSASDVENGQIKMISHNGANILYKRTLTGEFEKSTNVSFLENKVAKYRSPQSISSITVGENDYIFALDSTNCLIYMFDSECNTIATFGGGVRSGKQLGVFESPVALALSNGRLLVADSKYCSITVYEPTKYGKLITKAQTLFLNGDYSQAEPLWNEVLSMNRNCQLAYRGIAMANYSNGNYEAALEASKLALDYSIYDMAYQKLFTTFVSDNFVIIFFAVIILIGIGIYVAYVIKKKNIKIIKSRETKLLLRAPFHPFDTFQEIKFKKLGSIKLVVILLILFYIASVLNVTATGFLFKTTLLKNYNALFTLASTIGLVVLWSVCNWLVATLFSGKGTLKEVFVATTYSLMPLIGFYFIKVVLSNFIPLSMSGLVSGIETAIVLYTFFLLCIAIMSIHEFDFFKFITTGLVTIFFMILVVFVILMIAILVTQVGDFFISIYEEIAFR